MFKNGILGDSWDEMVIVVLRIVHHEILHSSWDKIGISLTTNNRPICSEAHKTRHSGFRRKYSIVLNHAAILEDTSSSNHHILPNVNIGADGSCRHNGSFAHKHMVPNVDGEKRHSDQQKHKC